MQKLKYAFALLAMAAVLALGALAPQAVAKAQDRRNLGKITCLDIGALNLEIETPKPYEQQIREKLAVLSTGYCIPASEEQTQNSREEILRIYGEEYERYASGGLINAYGPPELESCSPYLYIMEIQGSFYSNIVWHLEACFFDPDCGSNLMMTLDDETGKLLQIWYASNDTSWYLDGERALEQFCELYFTGLDLPEGSLAEVQDAQPEPEANVKLAEYSLQGEWFPEMKLTLLVEERRFEIFFT